MKGLKSLQRLEGYAPFSGQLLILDVPDMGLLFTCLLEINNLFKYLEKFSILQHYEQLSRKSSPYFEVGKDLTLKISFTLFEVKLSGDFERVITIL